MEASFAVRWQHQGVEKRIRQQFIQGSAREAAHPPDYIYRSINEC
jgi:hypothetical protein